MVALCTQPEVSGDSHGEGKTDDLWSLFRARSFESSSSKFIKGTAEELMLNVEQTVSRREFADISVMGRTSYAIRRTMTRGSETTKTKRRICMILRPIRTIQRKMM